VLKKMREPGSVLRLIAEPDVEVDSDSNSGGGLVLGQHHLETVLQFIVLDRDLE